MDYQSVKTWIVRGIIGFILAGIAALIFPPLQPLIKIDGLTIFGGQSQGSQRPILVDPFHPALTRPWDRIDNQADSREVIQQKVTRQQEKLEVLRAYFKTYNQLPAGSHTHIRESSLPGCKYELVAPSLQTFWCLQ
mgnify:CR=1 FL=1